MKDPRLMAMEIGRMARERMFEEIQRKHEALHGYTYRSGVKAYCCYGMYADVGHSDDCKHADPAVEGGGKTK